MAVRSTGTAVQRRRGSTFEENIVSSGSGKEMSRSAGKRAGRHRDVEEQWVDLLEVNIINQMKSIFDAKSGASNLASITSSNHAIAFSDDQFLGILAHMMIDCLEERLFRSEYTEKQIKRIEGDLRKEAGGIQIFERPQLKQLLKNMNDMYDDILLHEELNMNPGMDVYYSDKLGINVYSQFRSSYWKSHYAAKCSKHC